MYYLLLIIVFGLIIAGIYLKYEGEVSSLKRQIILISRQNKSLKAKMNIHTERIKNFKMKRIDPASDKGIITKDTFVRISPIKKAMPVNSIGENKIVGVKNIVEIDEIKWYQVEVKSLNKINDIGWVDGEYISLIDNSFSDYDLNESIKEEEYKEEVG